MKSKVFTHGAKALLQDLWESMRSEPGRVGLSFLAVTLGTVALVALLSVLGNLSDRARQVVDALGANVFAVGPVFGRSSERPADLRAHHVALLRAALPDCEISAIRRTTVPMGGVDDWTQVTLVDEHLAAVRGWRLERGRFLDRADLVDRQRNAVISRDLSSKLRITLGNSVVLDQIPFTVVGILGVDMGSAKVGTGDDPGLWGTAAGIYIPVTTPVERSWMPFSEISRVHQIFVKAPPAVEISSVVAAVQRLFRDPSLAMGDLEYVTPESMLVQVRRIQNTVRVAGGSVAFLCLVLGGTTLMSLMVANVRDRIPEIGLRRALGATGKDIAMMFVVEACLVTGAAAFVGSAVGVAVLWIARSQFDAPLSMSQSVVLVPFLVSILLGGVFAYWPARQAAGVTPAEALRNE